MTSGSALSREARLETRRRSGPPCWHSINHRASTSFRAFAVDAPRRLSAPGSRLRTELDTATPVLHDGWSEIPVTERIAADRAGGAATRCFRNPALGRRPPMDADSRRLGESGSDHSGFQEPAPESESNSRARFGAATRIQWRIGREIRHGPAPVEVSGFQEPGGWPARRWIVGVLGTGRRAGWPLALSGFQEPQGSGFQEPRRSGYWEPQCSGDQEPRLTVYSEPPFVVTGTHARGFRNRRLRKTEKFQRLADLSTALNALTSFYNRISS